MLRSLAVRSVLISTLALAAPALWAGPPPPPEPGDLLGSTGLVGAALIDIDPTTGAGTFRSSLNSLGPVTEIEFRADGVLFGTTGASTANVITIDPTTGAETLVGQHAPGSVNGLEFAGGVLYGSYFPSMPPLGEGDGPAIYALVTVDQTDGSLTTIGPIDLYFPIRGLAYDEATGTMYGIGVPQLQPPPSAGEPEGLSDVLFTIDLTTAETTAVGPTGFFLGALEFGPDGTLYGGTEGGGGGGLGEGGSRGPGGWQSGEARDADGNGGGALLVTIDTASGAGTAVGPTGFPAISGLSFVPPAEQGGPSVLEIPTASALGLAALALLLAAAGLVAVRRRG